MSKRAVLTFLAKLVKTDVFEVPDAESTSFVQFWDPMTENSLLEPLLGPEMTVFSRENTVISCLKSGSERLFSVTGSQN